jgi:DNA-binding MarR family transcriptional regulator
LFVISIILDRTEGDILIEKTNGGFYISQIKYLQGRVFEKMLSEAGVNEFNGAQGRILYILWQSDSMPIVELSKRTGLAKNTLTGMLDRMEAAGLINRNADKKDRRQIRITLTPKARELNGSYDEVSLKMSETFYKSFSNDEILRFENDLRRIIDNLNGATD